MENWIILHERCNKARRDWQKKYYDSIYNKYLQPVVGGGSTNHRMMRRQRPKSSISATVVIVVVIIMYATFKAIFVSHQVTQIAMDTHRVDQQYTIQQHQEQLQQQEEQQEEEQQQEQQQQEQQQQEQQQQEKQQQEKQQQEKQKQEQQQQEQLLLQQQKEQQEDKTIKPPVIRPTVDIISIGSLNKVEFQDAQQRTFGSAPNVRNFIRINELNDTDISCYTTLTGDQMYLIRKYCAEMEHRSYFGKKLDMLVLEKQVVGWICAQKRPVDGLYHTLQSYKPKNIIHPSIMDYDIPDYLFIIDDDTYLNLDRLIPDLQVKQKYTTVPSQPMAHSGCLYWFLQGDVVYPHGGYGTYLNQRAIQRLLQPIYCHNTDEHKSMMETDQHTYLACRRIKQNDNGEQRFFQDGMSVNDLMYAYTSQLKFTEVENWTDVGYCFHSDHTLGYFITFYHILAPDGAISLNDDAKIDIDEIRRKYYFSDFPGKVDCNRGPEESLELKFRIYHYMHPNHMDAAHAAWQEYLFNMTNVTK